MRKRLISVLTAAVLVATACSSSTATPSPTTAPAPTTTTPTAAPVATSAAPGASPTAFTVGLTGSTYQATPATTTGGSIVVAEWQFPDTLNPYYAQAETDIEASGSMFDGLLTVTPDLKYAPDLASNVPTVDNGGVVLKGAGMDVTWNLKPNMKWSDGQPINCDDVKATWQWVMDPANTGLAGGTVGWENITGVDGGTTTTCVVHFNAIYEGYLSLISPVLPAHYISTVSVADAPTKLYPLDNVSSGVYSGPYIPTDLKTDAQITLKPNPNWQTIGGHAPYLDSVILKYYGDAETMIAGYQAGEYDLGQDLNDADIPSLASIDKSQVVIHDSLTYELNAFNNDRLKSEFGGDATTIIQAVKLATDRQAIANGPLAGNVTVSNNFISPLTWYYKDLGGSTAADPTTASTMLANAGWTMGSDGYLTKGGKTLELDVLHHDPPGSSGHAQAHCLAAEGDRHQGRCQRQACLLTSSADGTARFGHNTPATCVHGNFDVAEFAYVSPLDPLGGYLVYTTVGIPDNPPHDGQNVTRISLPVLDSAYLTVLTNVDFSKVRDAMYTVQDIYGSDQNTYELPLYYRKDVWLVNPKLHNFTGNPTTSAAEWNIGDWWVG